MGWIKIRWGALTSGEFWPQDFSTESMKLLLNRTGFILALVPYLAAWQKFLNFSICFIIYKMGPLLPRDWMRVNAKYLAPVTPLMNLISLASWCVWRLGPRSWLCKWLTLLSVLGASRGLCVCSVRARVGNASSEFLCGCDTDFRKFEWCVNKKVHGDVSDWQEALWKVGLGGPSAPEQLAAWGPRMKMWWWAHRTLWQLKQKLLPRAGQRGDI